MKKTLHNWINQSDKDLDEYLSPGDYIDKDLFYYISEIIPPAYLSKNLLQVVDPIKCENGVLFYMTIIITPDKKYLYLGVLPEFKQNNL
jgi:hypothetical protein